MSRYVEFELRVRGKKADCEQFSRIVESYERYASDLYEIGSGGNSEDYIMCIGGACSSSVSRTMLETSDNIESVSKELNLEIEVYGSDQDDGDEFEHYHYKNGNCISSFNLPLSFFKDEFDEMELDNEDIEKYDYKEADESYSLRQEYIPKAHWSYDEENDENIMECDWSIPDTADLNAENSEEFEDEDKHVEEEYQKELEYMIKKLGKYEKADLYSKLVSSKWAEGYESLSSEDDFSIEEFAKELLGTYLEDDGFRITDYSGIYKPGNMKVFKAFFDREIIDMF